MQNLGEAAAPKEHFTASAEKNISKHRRTMGGTTPPTDNAGSGTETSAPASSSPAPAAKTTETATRSIAAAMGGGVTAIAGVVAASVVTAVIVVTTFLAVLGVNLSLVMADYTSLTFRLELVT
ncbi:MAG: hypothetical protein IK037_02905, partial [Clostridia bacterium]|nr:hypothetical protein [Clostridia bacterium]